MPRNKTVRQSAAESDAQNGRDRKKEMLLRDFEMQYANQKAQMERDGQALIRDIEQAYLVALMKIPKAVRAMKVGDYIASGGNLDELFGKKFQEEIDNQVQSATEKVKVLGASKRQAAIEKKQQAQASGQGATTTRTKGKRGAAVLIETTGADTPLFTPKFDPRLPVTPKTGRVPHPGEMLVSKRGSLVLAPTRANLAAASSGAIVTIPEEALGRNSVAESNGPSHVRQNGSQEVYHFFPGEDEVQLTIALPGGQALQISDKTALTNETMPQLNQQTMSAMKTLHKQLGAFLHANK